MKIFIDTLRESGLEVVTLGGKVAVMPFGGRVIALAPDGETNVLWTNPRLDSPSSARSFLEGSGWLNVGGDRTWISPEVDTHVADPSRFAETYEVPKVVDPGAYRITYSETDSVMIESDMDVLFGRSRRTVSLHLAKRVTLIEPTIDVPDGVDAACYELAVTLEAASELSADPRPAAWNLLQVPGGGRITIPVKARPRTRALIGSPVFTAGEESIECEVSTDASFKFGIYVDDSVGSMRYTRVDGDRAVLIMRAFDVHPADVYSDVPCDDPTAHGYIQQFYIDDGALGGFGELEYHTPALSADNPRVSDRSRVYAFSGPVEALSAMQGQRL